MGGFDCCLITHVGEQSIHLLRCTPKVCVSVRGNDDRWCFKKLWNKSWRRIEPCLSGDSLFKFRLTGVVPRWSDHAYVTKECLLQWWLRINWFCNEHPFRGGQVYYLKREWTRYHKLRGSQHVAASRGIWNATRHESFQRMICCKRGTQRMYRMTRGGSVWRRLLVFCHFYLLQVRCSFGIQTKRVVSRGGSGVFPLYLYDALSMCVYFFQEWISFY